MVNGELQVCKQPFMDLSRMNNRQKLFNGYKAK